MDTCFIIQPFDKDKFDQRYIDVFEPAIKAAKLQPYRIDRDPSVRIPIEDIEEGIKTSKLCFAEITLDNPNVWYELGFAFAMGKDVIMVTEQRQKYPFDIQHRQVISYKTSSKSDYEKLESDITSTAIALLQSQNSISQIIESPIKESDGLKQHEITTLLFIFESSIKDEGYISTFMLNKHMDKAGFNSFATTVSIKALERKGLIDLSKLYDEYGENEFIICRITEKGEEWVLQNQDKIHFRK